MAAKPERRSPADAPFHGSSPPRPTLRRERPSLESEGRGAPNTSSLARGCRPPGSSAATGCTTTHARRDMNASTALSGDSAEPRDPSDARIIAAVRAGETGDFTLLRRRHAGPARRAARAIAPSADVDAMVDEAFATILRAAQAGGGPEDAVRPHLLAALRHAAARRAPDHGAPAAGTSADGARAGDVDPFSGISERSSVAAVFATLPPHHRTLLWYLDVERMRPRELAPLIGLAPDAVSALASDARDAFRRAWLDAHLDDPARPEECRWFGERVGAHVGALSAFDAARFHAHADTCPSCQVVAAEIDTLSRRLRSILPAALIGGTAAGRYLRLAAARRPDRRRSERARRTRSS